MNSNDPWDGLGALEEDVGVSRGPKSGRKPNPGHQTKSEILEGWYEKKKLKAL